MGLFDFLTSKEAQRRKAIGEIIRAYKQVIQQEKQERSNLQRFKEIEARISYLESELTRVSAMHDKKAIMEELERLIREEEAI